MKALAIFSGVLISCVAAGESPNSLDATLIVLDGDEITTVAHTNQLDPYLSVHFGTLLDDVEPVMNVRFARTADQLKYSFGWWDQDLRRISGEASELNERYMRDGLSIEPRETKIFRLSTHVYDTQHDLRIEAQLLEAATEQVLTLVFVDRPCSISGELRIGQRVLRHDIELLRSGYHFLQVDDENLVKAVEVRGNISYTVFH